MASVGPEVNPTLAQQLLIFFDLALIFLSPRDWSISGHRTVTRRGCPFMTRPSLSCGCHALFWTGKVHDAVGRWRSPELRLVEWVVDFPDLVLREGIRVPGRCPGDWKAGE
jgi:hypothetical protein